MLQFEQSEYKELQAIVIDCGEVKLEKMEEEPDDKLVPEPLINLSQNNKKSLFTLKINELNKDNTPTAFTTNMTKVKHLKIVIIMIVLKKKKFLNNLPIQKHLKIEVNMVKVAKVV